MSDYEKGFHSNTSSAYFQSGSQAWAGAEAAERLRRQQAEWDRQAQQQRDEQNRRANDARRQQANVSQTRSYTTAPQSHSYVTPSHVSPHQTRKSPSGVNGFALAVLAGIIIISAVGVHHFMKSTPISSGPAIVDNAPQLNLRDCPAANCGIITKLNKGDKVFVTKSYDNGWNAVTIYYNDGTTTAGFVNGDFLSQK